MRTSGSVGESFFSLRYRIRRIRDTAGKRIGYPYSGSPYAP